MLILEAAEFVAVLDCIPPIIVLSEHSLNRFTSSCIATLLLICPPLSSVAGDECGGFLAGVVLQLPAGLSTALAQQYAREGFQS